MQTRCFIICIDFYFKLYSNVTRSHIFTTFWSITLHIFQATERCSKVSLKNDFTTFQSTLGKLFIYQTLFSWLSLNVQHFYLHRLFLWVCNKNGNFFHQIVIKLVTKLPGGYSVYILCMWNKHMNDYIMTRIKSS